MSTVEENKASSSHQILLSCRQSCCLFLPWLTVTITPSLCFLLARSASPATFLLFITASSCLSPASKHHHRPFLSLAAKNALSLPMQLWCCCSCCSSRLPWQLRTVTLEPFLSPQLRWSSSPLDCTSSCCDTPYSSVELLWLKEWWSLLWLGGAVGGAALLHRRSSFTPSNFQAQRSYSSSGFRFLLAGTTPVSDQLTQWLLYFDFWCLNISVGW